MNYALAEWILSETRFDYILIGLTVGAFVLFRKKSSFSLLIFACGYYSTYLRLKYPEVFGKVLASQEDIYALQCLVSFAIVMCYHHFVEETKAIKWAAINEGIMVFINVGWLVSMSLAESGIVAKSHPWWHAFQFAIINHVSLFLLGYNHFVGWRNDRRSIRDTLRPNQELGHIVVNHSHFGEKA